MDSLTDDLWMMVLARLPIKIFTCFKIVCKQWKSIVESPFFRNLFLSMHQNSASSSSWSLMTTQFLDQEIMGYYQCDTWGLKRPLGSFINPILNEKSLNHNYLEVSAVAFSDVGLILICAISQIKEGKSSLFVANPVSHECVEIFLDPRLERNTLLCFSKWGIATRIENGVLLGYKVVVFNQRRSDTMLSCLIYSSETRMWSLDDTSFFNYRYSRDPISLNGKLHWITMKDDKQVVVLSMDLYTNNMGSDRCRVLPFPDLEKTTKFRRACTPCRGFLMYMNIVDENKLCVWRLQSEGWQLISQISPGSILTGGFGYAPLTINPIDATTAYFWSEEQDSLLYINLHDGKSVVYNQFQLTSDGHTVNDPRAVIKLKKTRRPNIAYPVRSPTMAVSDPEHGRSEKSLDLVFASLLCVFLLLLIYCCYFAR